MRYLGPRKWFCRCDCGTERAVDGATLRNRKSVSCGCFRIEVTKAHRTKHGCAKHGTILTEWNIWSNLRQRCYNPNNSCYHNYGGRGIFVCDRWRHSFEAFYADMGPRPSPHHTIERIDNGGPYSPENCCWATRKIQCRNTRRNHLITFAGETLPLAEWAERAGIGSDTILYRLKAGWSLDRALTASLMC